MTCFFKCSQQCPLSEFKCPNNTDFPLARRHDPLNQLLYLHFLCRIRSCCVCYLAVFHVTFLTPICETTYVPRWFRTDDSGMICCLLTPTLYHCATEDYGHALLFLYLYLNLPRMFLILNITVCNLIILCIAGVQTSYIF